jgi:hypothetical protein
MSSKRNRDPNKSEMVISYLASKRLISSALAAGGLCALLTLLAKPSPDETMGVVISFHIIFGVYLLMGVHEVLLQIAGYLARGEARELAREHVEKESPEEEN